MVQEHVAYPVRYRVEYPDVPLNRFTLLLRWIVVLGLTVFTPYFLGSSQGVFLSFLGILAAIGVLLMIAPLVAVLFTGRYPRGLFEFNVKLLRFINGIVLFLFLGRNELPGNDQGQILEVPYPPHDGELNRFMPLIKWVLTIPHGVLLFFLFIWADCLVIIGGIGAMFSGRFPRDWFDYIVDLLRWTDRVMAYSIFMFTDRYPPYRLSQ